MLPLGESQPKYLKIMARNGEKGERERERGRREEREGRKKGKRDRGGEGGTEGERERFNVIN